MSAGRESSTRVVHGVDELRAAVASARGDGRSIGLVPTMGALHAGHLQLIRAAVADKHYTVVSIYVNPTQFGPNEDYQRYPRVLDQDQAACAEAGVDLIFAPRDGDMYPPGDQTRVRPGPLAEPLCGAFRPGHFEGVCTVVAKLFHMVQPDAAYFGQKDAQQAIIIRRMVRDLAFPIDVRVMPTVREPDGLAMSSRNAMLSPGDRARALCLYRALSVGRDQLLAGAAALGPVLSAMRREIPESNDLRIDYLSIVDPETLQPIDPPAGRVLIAGAIRLDPTRLIDNLLVDLPPRGA